MEDVLLSPPLVFVIFLLIAFFVSKMSMLLSAKGSSSSGKEKAYACGEDVAENRVQPEYGQFFPFAFFFTIMHVVALIIATAPPGVTLLPVLYLAGAAVSISILFRR